MPKFLRTSLILILFSLLAGCSGNKCQPDGPCWRENFRDGSCGTMVQQRCNDICHQCKFAGAACDACWKCAEHDDICKAS